jgi:cyclic beta-1,2-glucan synthetase
LARNPYSAEFSEAVAFVAASKDPHGLTADRTEFLGRLQALGQPEALTRVGLTGRVEPGLDPCAALQIHIDLPANGSETIYFLIGQGTNRAATIELIQEYRNEAQIEATWQAVQHHWDAILGTVAVATPDPAMDLLLNRWLLYQALACRIWGRSALYQSSGAYGFRDQLQDAMSLIHARPDLTRAQILRAAHHQFEAGDVLHWWHPPAGRGVRTRITDDLAWLPYVTANYVAATGDSSILEEQVPFRRGDPLREGEEERYAQYELTNSTHTLYEHCRRALDRAVTAGRHGIPLMGGGDWNDGMNRVGIEGEGESIWLGWFLHAALTDFAHLCDARDDANLATHLREQAASISRAIEEQGWDGGWYRRAYFDDGTPLGSQENDECRIDAIAQSWAVISGAAQPDRARQAMEAVRAQLIKRDERLLLLFTPPFDKTTHDPGYIKGYLPGIRENGGQYTHAALWTIWAFAELGDGDEAEALFRLINPIYRAASTAQADIYKVEPYVIAADVYGVAPHQGRGGWTWYTGSSGWMYRLGIEAILGLRRAGDKLTVDPCIPQSWSHYSLTYRYQETVYTIRVENPQGVARGLQSVTVDGQSSADCTIPLRNDGGQHSVIVRLGIDSAQNA